MILDSAKERKNGCGDLISDQTQVNQLSDNNKASSSMETLLFKIKILKISIYSLKAHSTVPYNFSIPKFLT